MKILSCHIEAFGAMRNRSFLDLDAPVVIIEGDNEAGKSTFFHFLQTMLYGIYPGSEEKHPYAPRDGDSRMQGKLKMEWDHGGQYTVTRRLRSAPSGELVCPDGRSETLDNRDVPCMHISREVYKAMYALSLYDLVALQDKEKAWQAVQDRLVGGGIVDFIRPARSVTEELDAEAKTLWRSKYDRGSASKKIAERRAALNEKIREAKQRDRELRTLSDQASQYVQQDRDMSEGRTKLRAKKRRIDRLAPIRDRLRQIDDARRKASDADELAGIPDDPAAALEEVAGKIGEAKKQQKQIASEREDAERILAAVEAGEGFDLNMPPGNPYEGLLSARKNAEDELKQAEGQLVEKARQFLTVAWDDRFSDTLGRIAPAVLRERMKQFEDVQREADTRKQAEEVQRQAAAIQRASEPDVGTVRKVFRNQAILAGLLVAAAGLAAWLDRLELAVVLGVVGAILGYMAWQARTQTRREAASPFAASRSLEDIEADVDTQRAAVRDLMGDMPVPESRFDRPDMTLVSEVGSLQDAIQARQTIRERMVQCMDRLKTMARQKQDHIAELHCALKEKHASLETERDALKARLSEIGGGDAEHGIVVAAARKEEHRLAQTLEEKLRTDFAGEDMTKVREEIESLECEGAAWDASDEEAIAVNEQLEALNEEINALTEKRTAAEKDIENLLEHPTLATLESEREQLDSELEAVKERHDRLRLLQYIVREADRRFREAHQPDVLRRASEYVQTITGGWYERFDYDEDERLRIYPAGEPQRPSTVRPWPVGAPLSQGTLDQMYLAIRFALVDHLDDGKESLPVFLDEVFVNWDRDRRARCYDIFSEAAARRQVFVFTCHPWLAEEMEQALSAKRIPL